MAEPVDYANLPQRPRCAACGYDRTGSLHTPSCPECGYDNPADAVTLAGWNSYSFYGASLGRWPKLNAIMLIVCLVTVTTASVIAILSGGYFNLAVLAPAILFFAWTLLRMLFEPDSSDPPATLVVAPIGVAFIAGQAPYTLDPYQPNWQAELITKSRHSRITIRTLSKWGLLSIFSEPLIDFSFEHNSPEQARGVLQIIQAGIARAKAAAPQQA